jgi:hypothetical protein
MEKVACLTFLEKSSLGDWLVKQGNCQRVAAVPFPGGKDRDEDSSVFISASPGL